MKKRNFITAIVLLAVSIATLVETSKLPIGKLSSPQMGFFPFILALLLGFLSLLLLGQAMKEKHQGEIPSWVSSGRGPGFLLTIGVLFVFALFFERLGYLVSAFFLIALLFGVIGKRKWWVVTLVAFFSTIASYLVFGILLETQLPMGVFGR